MRPHIKVDFSVEADSPEDAARLLRWAAEKFNNGSAHPITEGETGGGKINWEVKSFHTNKGTSIDEKYGGGHSLHAHFFPRNRDNLDARG